MATSGEFPVAAVTREVVKRRESAEPSLDRVELGIRGAFDPPSRRAVRLRYAKSPGIAGLFEERLKGLEPSTFCMARCSEVPE
jgi:hypothetical protein